MAKLTFYRQKRLDGAIRTGVELDGDPIADRYEGGEGERNPILLWFVDLRCDGPGIPDDPDDAFQWLFDQAPVIRDGFARYAEVLGVGADMDLYALTWSDFSGVPEGVSMTIACSGTRRVDARELARIVAEIGDRWEEILRTLDLPQEVEDAR